MSATAPTLEEMTGLLEQSGYNPSIVPQLEAYVRASAASTATPYSFTINRTLIKMYQFFPHLEDESTTALVLLLALVEYPTSLQDLFLSLSLVPERIQTREPCATIIRCADLLDACQFVEFWSVYEAFCSKTEDDKLLHSLATQSKDKLVRSILPTVALTYREAPLKMVLGALNLQDAGQLSDLKSPSVESISSDSVVFVATPDNTKRKRVFQEGGVNFNAISSMMMMNNEASVAKE